MPRTIESIVACHQAATERRKKGLPVWKKTLNLRQFMDKDDDEPSIEKIIESAKNIGNQLRLELPSGLLNVANENYDMNLEEIVEHFEDFSDKREIDFGQDLRTVLEEELNGLLEEIYDWADANRYWIG